MKKIPLALFTMACLTAMAGLHLAGVSFSHYVEGGLLLGFGIWRLIAEGDRYQRFRVAFILVGVSIGWYLLPLSGFIVPRLGSEYGADLPGIHAFGTLAFFLFLIPVVLFGRAADCGWCCPCVGVRETVGYAFRGATPRGRIWWHLRHLKWPGLIAGLVLVPLPFVAPGLLGGAEERFYALVFYAYYGSFLLLPLLGNRNFCRFACPFGAVWGLVGRFGFFRIRAQSERCVACGTCDSVCDMGVPMSSMAPHKGTIRTTECMGCGRCVTACPRGVLEIHDVRGRRKIPCRTVALGLIAWFAVAAPLGAWAGDEEEEEEKQEEPTAIEEQSTFDPFAEPGEPGSTTFDPFAEADDDVVSEVQALKKRSAKLFLSARYGFTHRTGFPSATGTESTHIWTLGVDYRPFEALFAGVRVPIMKEQYREGDDLLLDEAGLSDLATYVGVQLPWFPLSLMGMLLWPTGSYEKGLGTGEFSGGLIADLSWTLGVVDMALGGYYLLIRDPEDVELPDSYGASFDAGVRLRKWLRLQAGFAWSFVTLITLDDVHQLAANTRLTWRLAPRFSLVTGVEVEFHPVTAVAPSLGLKLGL